MKKLSTLPFLLASKKILHTPKRSVVAIKNAIPIAQRPKFHTTALLKQEVRNVAKKEKLEIYAEGFTFSRTTIDVENFVTKTINEGPMKDKVKVMELTPYFVSLKLIETVPETTVQTSAEKSDVFPSSAGVADEYDPKIFEGSLLSSPRDSYLFLFKFSTVVFVNVAPAQQQAWLKFLVNTPEKQQIMRDDLRMVIDPKLEDWIKVGHNHLNTKLFDYTNCVIFAFILAQSTALRSYEDNILTILKQFKSETTTAQKQPYNAMFNNPKNMLKVISEGYDLKCDLLLHVRITDRPPSQSSWQYDQYDKSFSVLRTEFEIAERYNQLEKKLDFIQEQSQFYMNLLHNKNSEKAEILIIVLIAAELVLGLINLYIYFSTDVNPKHPH